MMNKFIYCLLIFVLLIISINTSLSASCLDNYTILTEDFPPFQYIDKKGKLTGSSVELLDLIFKELKSTKTIKDIKIYPWSRGYKLIRTKPNIMLFAMSRTPERNKLFKWAGPQIRTVYCLIAKKDKKIKIKSLKDITKYRIGVIRDDIGELLLIQKGIPQNKLYRTAKAESIIKQLENDWIDVWSYESTPAKWFIKNEGIDPNKYEIVYVIKEMWSSYAFSKDTPDLVISKVNKAWKKIRKSSEVKKIIKKYNYPPGHLR
ncbi:substrate-binding periplasmic protein [Candidatus Margulisiibacteriota bacterium]